VQEGRGEIVSGCLARRRLTGGIKGLSSCSPLPPGKSRSLVQAVWAKTFLWDGVGGHSDSDSY
jgi:hypothetical protein